MQRQIFRTQHKFTKCKALNDSVIQCLTYFYMYYLTVSFSASCKTADSERKTLAKSLLFFTDSQYGA